jgi:hypothetical protein
MLLPFIIFIVGTFVVSAWRHWGWFGILAGTVAGIAWYLFLPDTEEGSFLCAALVAAFMGSRLPRLDGLYASAAGILIAVVFLFVPSGGHTPIAFLMMAPGVGFSLGGIVAALIGYRRANQLAGVA